MSVSLSKGQSVSLQKSGGGTLTVVRMGLGWQAAPKKGLFGSRSRQIDLDASAVMFSDHQLADVVFFQHLVSNDGSVRHTGDNLTGGSGGEDDESILVDLPRVPEHVNQIVFTVNSYTGQTDGGDRCPGAREDLPGHAPGDSTVSLSVIFLLPYCYALSHAERSSPHGLRGREQ